MTTSRNPGTFAKTPIGKPSPVGLSQKGSGPPELSLNKPVAAPSGKDAFRTWAIAEAWTGAYLMEGHSFFSMFTKSPKSSLGGDMLRMYLRGQVDHSVVSKIAAEVAASDSFSGLTDLVAGSLRLKANRDFKSLPSAKQIETESRRFLKEWKKNHGIAFRGKLNPVVGGVTQVDVVGPARIISTSTTDKTSTIDFQINVSFQDRYDFNNTRTGAYETYRQHLYSLLLKGEYLTFAADYHSEFYLGSLGKLRVFASFMYAIERFGLTPGALTWSTVVPMRAKCVYP